MKNLPLNTVNDEIIQTHGKRFQIEVLLTFSVYLRSENTRVNEAELTINLVTGKMWFLSRNRKVWELFFQFSSFLTKYIEMPWWILMFFPLIPNSEKNFKHQFWNITVRVWYLVKHTVDWKNITVIHIS